MRTEQRETESAPLPESVQFGAFRLTQRPLRLWRGRKAVALQPRPLSVLRYLVEHPDVVVSSELLRQAVWGKTIVSPTTVQVCIRAVRKVLGDEVEDPHYIETVGQDGYRFIEKVVSSQPSVVSREEENQKSKDKRRRPIPSPYSALNTRYSTLHAGGSRC